MAGVDAQGRLVPEPPADDPDPQGEAPRAKEPAGPFVLSKFSPSSKVQTKMDKSAVSAWAAVGGKSEQIRLNQQLLAASNPSKYGKNRNDALERVKEVTNNYYKMSLASYISAGADLRAAEKKALAATAKVKDIEMDQFRLMYPESDLQRYIGATAFEKNKYYSAEALDVDGGNVKKRGSRKKKKSKD
jgi:hypothetical protein